MINDSCVNEIPFVVLRPRGELHGNDQPNGAFGSKEGPNNASKPPMDKSSTKLTVNGIHLFCDYSSIRMKRNLPL